MKALISMISAVLLIAFTVAVAGIVSTWLPGFFGGVTGNVGAKATDVRCLSAYIEILKVSISVSNNTYNTTLIVYNPSLVEIKNVNLLTDNGEEYFLNETLLPGEMKAILTPIPIQDILFGKIKNIILYGLCSDGISVWDECSLGEECWRIPVFSSSGPSFGEPQPIKVVG